jgi:hypothetical protein
MPYSKQRRPFSFAAAHGLRDRESSSATFQFTDNIFMVFIIPVLAQLVSGIWIGPQRQTKNSIHFAERNLAAMLLACMPT